MKRIAQYWLRKSSGRRLALLAVLIFFASESIAAGTDTARFNDFLRKGNTAYSQKDGFTSFATSLHYFDSAEILAEQSGDRLMLARATAARGRVYDAWGREPEKTVGLFTKASDLFQQAGDEAHYFYYKHLVAHTYDKIGDSTAATGVLRELVRELSHRDTATQHLYDFIPELALIATEVHAYPLADSILRGLTRREWIANNPASYNYLDHYYLTKSRLDIFWRKAGASPYIDSFATAYTRLIPRFDRVYYAAQLAQLTAATGRYPEAYRYRSEQLSLNDSLTETSDFEQLQRALTTSETGAARRRAEYESSISRTRAVALWVLSLSLIVITILSAYLYQRTKKYRAQSLHLRDTNQELDKHIGQVELLNKEIQHRVKNNLYTIYSLLHMQQDSTENEEVIAHLEAARMRVESVAALHDHLLAGSDTVDFGAYVKMLITKVVTCYAERRNIITHISTEPVSLPLNTCFALSLILNEWITNSIKYAVSKADVLDMNLRIVNTENEVCIDYSDSGEFIPNLSPAKGLGTEIVRLLNAQINGRLTIAQDRPYQYNLCIPNG